MPLITDIFEKEGTHFAISGNSPIMLSGTHHVWCLLSGSAEVFAVQLEGGKNSGPKEHFFSAGIGDFLFGMDLDAYGIGQGFQAVGYPGTRVACLDLCRLKELGGSTQYSRQIAEKIDRWTEGLSKGLTKDIIPFPKPDQLLKTDEKFKTDHNLIVCPVKGNVWIEYLEESGLYIGIENIVPSNKLLPLSQHSWLRMFKGSSIRSVSTRDALARDSIWASMEDFYERIFQIMFLNIGLKTVDVYNLLLEKGEQQRRARQDGLKCLASIMDDGDGYAGQTDFDDVLVSACSRVGQVLGLSVSEPRKITGEAAPSKLTVEDIARASGFNIRKVVLSENWWQQDIGPLVGFTTGGKLPIALLPVSATAYEAVDPQTGKSEKLTAKTAVNISATAYTFYRSFPDRALTGLDLIKFGLKGCGKDLKWVITLAVAIGLLSLITPLATGLVFSDIIPSADRVKTWGIAAIVAGFAVSTLLFEITRNVSLLRIENRLHYVLESAVWDRLLRLSTSFFREYETGDLTTRTMGLNMIRQMVSGPVVTTITSSLFTCFNLFLLFYYNSSLALVASGLLFFSGLVILGLSLWQLKYIRQQTHIEGRIASRVMQFLSAITKLRVSGAEDNAFAIWAKDFSRQKKLSFKTGMVQNVTATFINNFLLFSLMVIFSWMILRETGDILGTGDFLAFNAAFAALNVAMVQMIMALTNFIMAIPYYERLRPILETCPETDALKTNPGALSGKIEMCHIFFRYAKDSPMVLKDVSLNVEPGAFVAIVGGSGSGKSTLIRLLLGFEKAESGTIFYDDQDLADLDVRMVRQNMGVVLQGGNIMAGDIFTNIIGNYPMTIDDAWEAATMAGMDQDIKEMPMGMHTMVMEGASTLSGGQRQRLLIARAIVNRPRIIIFDEATSALDNRTQAIVSQSLKKLKTTRIVVAHRLSTVKDADLIHVMDRGEVKESGTYDELMAKDGLFTKLAKRQIF